MTRNAFPDARQDNPLPRVRRRFLAFWLLAGALEFPWTALAWTGKTPLPFAAMLAAHLCAAVAMAFAPPKGGGWLSPMRHWAEPGFLWTLAFPGLGWLFVGGLRLTHRKGQDPPDFQRAEEMEQSAERPAAPIPLGNIASRMLEAADVLPATDILLGRDVPLKRGAIETLAKLRSREAIEWILRARRDPSPDVRFFATSTLTNLRRDYEAALRAARREIFAKPMDLGPQLALAHVAYDYARSGLQDEASSREMLERAREALAALAADSDDALRLLYRVERELSPARALGELETLLKRLPAERTAWLMETARLQFRAGDYSRLRSTLALLEAEPPPSSSEEKARWLKWRSVLLWWRDD